MRSSSLGRALDQHVRLLAPARRLRFELVAQTLERFAAGGSLRVLDAGCGEGLFAESIARRHPGWAIVGVDRDADLLEHARLSLHEGRLANVELVRADLTSDLGDALYDAVVAIECLEEIPDDTQALRRMIAALRPGGLFVAHVPERAWEPVLSNSEATWRHEVRHGYESAEFASRLTELGLEDVDIRGTSRSLVRLAQELRDRARKRRLILRGALFPWLLVAVRLELRGVTWGRERALLVSGRRPVSARG